jgi:hypothetical protein
MTNKFSLDKFLNALDMDEEMALNDATRNDHKVTGQAYRPCPRCGSRRWKILNVNPETGRTESCDRCEGKQQ